MKEILEDYIRKVEEEIDLIDTEYQDKNSILRDTVWSYHNRIRLIISKTKQELLNNNI